ncbi:MAG: L,D-transpeptidase family protein [Sporomusaceae bacterium]|nr:L,D-transpeptidase family protein [Sporomusaceae bacterium]
MGCFKLALCVMVIVVLLANQPVYIQAMSKNSSSEIIINLPSRTLEYYEDNKLIKEYPVAIGKPSTPTPRGIFKIIDKEVNPSWYPPDKKGYVVSSGPGNPLGYRWLGFGANYGIHGTNAPWSIGSVVSNGCIRMFEEDVEELYVQIQYNTPVHIIYERIKLRIDNIGQASIGIYPDVYGYENITLGQVKHKLVIKKLGNLLEDGFLSQLIAEEKGEQVPFAKLYYLKINNKQLAEYLVSWEGIIYAPVSEVSANLDTAINWDEQQQLVIGKQHAVPGLKKNNTLYVAINHLPTLFGVKQMWDTDNNCLTINAMELLMAGEPVTRNIQIMNNTNYVPIFKVAKALNRKLYWEEQSQTLWLGGRKISVTMLADEPYIEASKISDYFNVSIAWDMLQQTINMNYFSDGIDYSMYLGEMGDFVD